jgi:hypothetical protein
MGNVSNITNTTNRTQKLPSDIMFIVYRYVHRLRVCKINTEYCSLVYNYYDCAIALRTCHGFKCFNYRVRTRFHVWICEHIDNIRIHFEIADRFNQNRLPKLPKNY